MPSETNKTKFDPMIQDDNPEWTERNSDADAMLPMAFRRTLSDRRSPFG